MALGIDQKPQQKAPAVGATSGLLPKAEPGKAPTNGAQASLKMSTLPTRLRRAVIRDLLVNTGRNPGALDTLEAFVAGGRHWEDRINVASRLPAIPCRNVGPALARLLVQSEPRVRNALILGIDAAIRTANAKAIIDWSGVPEIVREICQGYVSNAFIPDVRGLGFPTDAAERVVGFFLANRHREVAPAIESQVVRGFRVALTVGEHHAPLQLAKLLVSQPRRARLSPAGAEAVAGALASPLKQDELYRDISIVLSQAILHSVDERDAIRKAVRQKIAAILYERESAPREEVMQWRLCAALYVGALDPELASSVRSFRNGEDPMVRIMSRALSLRGGAGTTELFALIAGDQRSQNEERRAALQVSTWPFKPRARQALAEAYRKAVASLYRRPGDANADAGDLPQATKSQGFNARQSGSYKFAVGAVDGEQSSQEDLTDSRVKVKFVLLSAMMSRLRDDSAEGAFGKLFLELLSSRELRERVWGLEVLGSFAENVRAMPQWLFTDPRVLQALDTPFGERASDPEIETVANVVTRMRATIQKAAEEFYGVDSARRLV